MEVVGLNVAQSSVLGKLLLDMYCVNMTRCRMLLSREHQNADTTQMQIADQFLSADVALLATFRQRGGGRGRVCGGSQFR